MPLLFSLSYVVKERAKGSLFLLYTHNILQRNCGLLQDLNSDRWSRMETR